MSDNGEPTDLVLDQGTFTTRAGFAGDDAPRSCEPTVVGTCRVPKSLLPSATKKQKPNLYIGGEALNPSSDYCANRFRMTIREPMSRGEITHWDDMEQFWHKTFYEELRVDPETSRVLIMERLLNPKVNRQKITEFMFETFQVQGLYVALAEILGVYASGRSSAMLVDSGGAVTSIAPVAQGVLINDGVRRYNFGGCDVTDELERLLFPSSSSSSPSHRHTERDEEKQQHPDDKKCAEKLSVQFSSSSSPKRTRVLSDIKEKLAFIASEDVEGEELLGNGLSTQHTKPFLLPDETPLTLGPSRFRCTEQIFYPSSSFDKNTFPGLHCMVADSVYSCPIDERRTFCANIVLAGGNTLFLDLADRLRGELVKFEDRHQKTKTCLSDRGSGVRIVAAPERKYSSWIGGSILASLSTFERSMWVTRHDYDEVGCNVIQQQHRSQTSSLGE